MARVKRQRVALSDSFENAYARGTAAESSGMITFVVVPMVAVWYWMVGEPIIDDA